MLERTPQEKSVRSKKSRSERKKHVNRHTLLRFGCFCKKKKKKKKNKSLQKKKKKKKVNNHNKCLARKMRSVLINDARTSGSMLENERLQSQRHQGVERQVMLTDDSGAKTLESGVVQGVDQLVNGLRLFQQLHERLPLQVHLVEVTSPLQHSLHSRRWTRLALR